MVERSIIRELWTSVSPEQTNVSTNSRQFYQNEQQRDNGSTKMTFHNYPNEWLPEIDFDTIQTPKGQNSNI